MSIDDELLQDQQELRRETAFIRSRLPEELKHRFSDQEIADILEATLLYYFDHDVFSGDDDADVDINLSDVAQSVCGALAAERGYSLEPDEVSLVVEADLDFQESMD